MNNSEITVVYKWTAKPGQLDALKSIYDAVASGMEENEPDALLMACYYADDDNAIVVHDLFKDGNALGTHLMGTAAKHFPELLEIAEPGPFFFCGDVPQELKQAANGMGLGAVFANPAVGFSRV